MIQSVDRAARILHELGSGSPTLGVTELGARLDLAKPTVHGLLRTLEQSGLVSQDVATGRYSLGPRVLQLGNAYLAGSELRSRSMLRAGSLARQVDEAVWVSVLVDDAVMVVHHEFRPDDAVQILEVGATIPWHACALGHAMVAALPEGEVDALLAEPLRALTGRTRTRPRRCARRWRSCGQGFRGREPGGERRRRRHRGGDLRPRRPGGRVARAWSARPSGCCSGRPRRELSRAVVETARAVSRDLGASRAPGTRAHASGPTAALTRSRPAAECSRPAPGARRAGTARR